MKSLSLATPLPSHQIRLLVGGFLVLLGIAIASLSVMDYRARDAAEGARLAEMARRFEVALATHLRSARDALEAIRVHVATDTLHGISDDNWHLRDIASALQAVRSLDVVDDRGLIGASTQSERIGRHATDLAWMAGLSDVVAPASRYAMRAHVDPSGVTTLELVEVTLDTRGQFAGAVVAAFDMAYLGELLDAARDLPDVSVALLSADGQLIARQPQVSSGFALNPTQIQQLLAAHRAHATLTSLISAVGEERGSGRHRAALRTIATDALGPAGQLVVLVTRDLGPVIDAWQRDSALLGGAWLLIVALGVLIVRRGEQRRQALRRQHALEMAERDRQAEETLRNNQILKSVFDYFPGAVALFDAELRLRAHNALYQQLLELPDDVFSRPNLTLTDLARYCAQRGDFGAGDVDDLVCMVTTRARNAWQGKYERTTAKGVTLEFSGAPLPDGGFITVFADISERKKAERALIDERAHLEETVAVRTRELTEALAQARLADQTKDAFLANISHELRTPLNAVIGLAGLARNISRDTRQLDYLAKIITSGRHLNRLINDLLDLSKIAAGHMDFEHVSFSLRALITHCNELMAQRAHEKGLELREHVGESVPDVLRGDPARIEQILLNLVGNAIKFTESGHVSVRADLQDEDGGRLRLMLRIEDSGMGMSEETAARLFQPFTQADATIGRQFGGTGLGLAISRQLAMLMDGDITVQSQPGVGSCFTVRLCLARGDAAELADSHLAQTHTGATQASYRDVHVLVAEDQALNREIVAGLLEHVGIGAELVDNGRAAVELLRTRGAGAFDLVLMDVQMPVQDGLSATRAIRALPGFAGLPVIAMTAHTMTHEKSLCTEAGMNDHIAKPFDNADFYNTLGRWIAPAKRCPAGDAAALNQATTTRDGAATSEPVAALPSASAMSPDAPPGAVLLDLVEGLARFNGKTERFTFWLKQFFAQLPGALEELRGALARGEREAAHQLAHSLKGRAGMLGLNQVQALAAALDAAITHGETCDVFVTQLAQGIAQTHKALETAHYSVNPIVAPIAVTHPPPDTGAANAAPAPGTIPAEVAPPAVASAAPATTHWLGRLLWSDAYSMGLPGIDEQHRRLFALVNELAERIERGAQRENTADGLSALLSALFDYALSHFVDEEGALERAGHPMSRQHREEHDAFSARVTEFNHRLATGRNVDLRELHAFLYDWLRHHVLEVDLLYRVKPG